MEWTSNEEKKNNRKQKITSRFNDDESLATAWLFEVEIIVELPLIWFKFIMNPLLKLLLKKLC